MTVSVAVGDNVVRQIQCGRQPPAGRHCLRSQVLADRPHQSHYTSEAEIV